MHGTVASLTRARRHYRHCCWVDNASVHACLMAHVLVQVTHAAFFVCTVSAQCACMLMCACDSFDVVAASLFLAQEACWLPLLVGAQPQNRCIGQRLCVCAMCKACHQHRVTWQCMCTPPCLSIVQNVWVTCASST